MDIKKTAVITGANGGMGREITREVALKGFRVIMICYDKVSGTECRDRIAAETNNNDIEVVQTNLASIASIMNTTDYLLKELTSIELLMNNAGTMATHYHTTEDGFEYTVGVNYIAPYLLTRRLLPLMHFGTRIVNMVSCTYAIGKIDNCFFTKGKNGAFWRIPIYSNTKLALWLFSRELANRLEERGITVNAADPGIVSTKIITMHMWFDPLTDIFFRPCISSPRQGADTAIRLLLYPEFEGCTGGMYVSGHQRKLKPKYIDHPQMLSLWEDTEKILVEKGAVI